MHNMLQAWDAVSSFPVTTNSAQWIQMAFANNALPTEQAWKQIRPDGYLKTSEGNPLTAMCPFQCQHYMITCRGMSIERHRIMDVVTETVYGVLGNRTVVIANPFTLNVTFEMEYHERQTQELANNVGPMITSFWIAWENEKHLHKNLLPEKARSEIPVWSVPAGGNTFARWAQ